MGVWYSLTSLYCVKMTGHHVLDNRISKESLYCFQVLPKSVQLSNVLGWVLVSWPSGYYDVANGLRIYEDDLWLWTSCNYKISLTMSPPGCKNFLIECTSCL